MNRVCAPQNMQCLLTVTDPPVGASGEEAIPRFPPKRGRGTPSEQPAGVTRVTFALRLHLHLYRNRSEPSLSASAQAELSISSLPTTERVQRRPVAVPRTCPELRARSSIGPSK